MKIFSLRSFYFYVFCIFKFLISENIVAQTIPEPERVRSYDVLHYNINVTPDIAQKKIAGTVIGQVVPLDNNFNILELDAVAFKVFNVKINGVDVNSYTNTGKQIQIMLDRVYSTNDTITYEISYECFPQRGFYFVHPTELDPSHPYQFWTQGEGEDNKHWIPIYDYPNDKSTSEIYVTVDENFKTISNGSLVETQVSESTGKKTDHWAMDKPHVSYLIMLGGGDYHIFEEHFEHLPIQSYIDQHKIAEGEYSFRRTDDMVGLFNNKFGVWYPWANYKQVVVKDFIYGGMENTTATVLNERAYFDQHVEDHYTSEPLIAHELGHQWWGDLITCKNWSELWLNESFATYSDDLWNLHVNGKDEFDYGIMKNGDAFYRAEKRLGRFSIWAGRGSVTANIYDKGAVTLNMMRDVVGDSLFYMSLQSFLLDNAFKTVETQDLVNSFNKIAGASNVRGMNDFKWMFDQWIWNAGYPEFEVSYTYDDVLRQLKYKVKQTQKIDSLTPVFQMPLKILIKSEAGEQIEEIFIKDADEGFVFTLIDKPSYIVFNHENTYLAKTDYKRSHSEAYEQTLKNYYAINRISAIREIKNFEYDKIIPEILNTVLLNDEFWGARYEAAMTLSKFDKKRVREVLREAYYKNDNPKVKRGVIDAIGIIGNDEDKNFINNILKTEQDEYLIAEALKSGLKVYPREEYRDKLINFKDNGSHRNVVVNAVLDGLDSLSRINPDAKIKDALISIAFGKDIDGRVRAKAVDALRFYAADPQVKSLAKKYLDWNFRVMEESLIQLLGRSEDRSMITTLKELDAKTTDDAIHKQIDKAIKKLEK